MKKKIIVSITACLLAVCGFLPVVLYDNASASQNITSERVNKIYDQMTKKERIAQMFMVQARNWKGQGFVRVIDQDLKDIYADYKFGAFIAFAPNMQDTKEILQMSKDIQASVTSKGGVPMLISTDQEGGRVQRIGTGTPMPGNMAVGATENLKNAEISGRVISEELDALGYNTTLAPDFDINSNPGNPIIATRSFGDVPENVGNFGNEFLEGLKAKNTIGCIKHFAGHGDTDVDSHTGCPMVDKSWDELNKFELVPFKIGISRNVEMVMTAHIIYPQVDNSKILATRGEHKGEYVGTPATLSKEIITNKLKGELGFNGVVCTDSMGMAGVSGILETAERDAMAINAGVDMLCMPLVDGDINTPEAFRTNADKLIQAISEKVDESRIEDAVKRILSLKEKKGILDYDESKYTLDRALNTVGKDEFRQEERDMAADGVTLVKNTDNLLPLKLKNDSKILMLVQDHNEGYHEKYAAQFILAWNRAKAAGLIPQGATVDVVMFDKDNWENESILSAIDNADIVFTNSIVRSTANMAYKKWQTAAPKKYTDYAHEKGKKSIVISIDAPYDVQHYPSADAIFAVYNLTGSKLDWKETLDSGATTSKDAMGANLVAAVEVAFGTYGAYGKLPVNIYEFDINKGGTKENPGSYTDKIIYNRGFGIQYDPITDINKVNISLDCTEKEYTGESICPKVIATVETRHANEIKTLVQDKDYSVEYSNNINVGTANVKVSGLGSYFGDKSLTFQIIDNKLVPGSGSDNNNNNNNNNNNIATANSTQTYDFPYKLIAISIIFTLSIIVFVYNCSKKNLKYR